jgi:hypothetical protein
LRRCETCYIKSGDIPESTCHSDSSDYSDFDIESYKCETHEPPEYLNKDDRFEAVLLWNRLSKTYKRRVAQSTDFKLGLVPCTTKEGDLVGILNVYLLPVILRKHHLGSTYWLAIAIMRTQCMVKLSRGPRMRQVILSLYDSCQFRMDVTKVHFQDSKWSFSRDGEESRVALHTASMCHWTGHPSARLEHDLWRSCLQSAKCMTEVRLRIALDLKPHPQFSEVHPSNSIIAYSKSI